MGRKQTQKAPEMETWKELVEAYVQEWTIKR